MSRRAVQSLLAALLPAAAWGLRWPIEHLQLNLSDVFVHSEYWVYGTDDGPWPVREGKAYYELSMDFSSASGDVNSTWTFFAVFTRTLEHTLLYYLDEQDPVPRCCSEEEVRQFVSLDRDVDITRVEKAVSSWDAEKLRHVANMSRRIDLDNGAVRSLLFCGCPSDDIIVETPEDSVKYVLDGEITYVNPYGFFRGSYFGEIPFEFARFVCFLFYNLAAIWLLLKQPAKYRLGLHWGILAVLIVGWIEAMCWFALYVDQNLSGEPLCCPFPTAYGAAIVFDVLRATLSRAVLLLVCLGVWVVRDRLTHQEMIAFAGMTLSFLAVGIAFHATEMQLAENKTEEELWDAENNENMNLWQFPWALLNVAYLSWIYIALTNMMQLLKMRGQTYKLSMYMRLGWVIVVSVCLFVIMQFVFLLAELGAFRYPWTLLWWDDVAWKLLNFMTIIALSWIWRPNERTFLLSLSSQLPTEEDEAFSTDVASDDFDGIAFGDAATFSILPDVANEEDDDDLEGAEPAGFQGLAQRHKATDDREDRRNGNGNGNGVQINSSNGTIFDDSRGARDVSDATAGENGPGGYGNMPHEDFDGIHIGKDEAIL
mmetsp:Transcript_4586/g.18077  ORF Transcript_4586/g.18077 Transcript_4586/m.18077 type:complete len:596 (-) Transcript_4586:1880-3667(-)